MQGEPVTQVRVINKNTFAIKDKYDGVDFVFPPNKPVNCPMEVAAHVFGYFPRPDMDLEQAYEAMKLYCKKRFGWNTPKHEAEDNGQKFFENLDIQPVRFQLVEVAEKEAAGKKA